MSNVPALLAGCYGLESYCEMLDEYRCDIWWFYLNIID